MEKLSVQVKEGTLRATPSFLGKTINMSFTESSCRWWKPPRLVEGPPPR
jgi:hypothetical protein